MKRVDSSEVLIKIIFSWYVVVFITVSSLSFFNILNRPLVLLVEIVFLSWTIYFIKKNISKIRVEWVVILILILLILTFIQGLFSAPNTTDSLTYHLPRVIHWMQNQSVYQNVILNDHDYMPPFGEYLDLFFYQITNSDRFVFLSQWLSYVGSILLAGLIAKQLKGSKNLINISRLSVAVIPMAILQASSTQTDLVTSFLFLIAIFYSLKMYKNFNYQDLICYMIGCCLGFLTKPTFGIFALVPAGLVLLSFWRRDSKIIDALKIFIASIILGIIFLAPYFYQNIKLYDSFLGQNGNSLIFSNEQISVKVIISSIIKNLMLQIPVPIFANQVQLIIESIHQFIGLDVNDPKTTWYGTSFNVLGVIYPQEDLVSNPLQIFIFLVAFWILFKKPVKDYFIKKYLFSGIAISFILFCTILKWQPWNSRLHLPLIILITIVSVLVLDKHKFILKIFIGVSYGLAILLIIFNVSRPLITYPQLSFVQKYNIHSQLPESIFTKPRIQQYFNSRVEWYDPYQQMSKIIASEKPENIKIITIDGFEYPLLVLLKDDGYLPKTTKFSTNLFSTDKNPNITLGSQKCLTAKNNYGFVCLAKLK